MKNLFIFTTILLSSLFLGCTKENEDIFCHDPEIVTKPKWDQEIPLNKSYIKKSIVIDDFIYLFSGFGKEKLLFFNKKTLESKTFDIESSYESLVYDKAFYYTKFNENEGCSIIKLDLITNETMTIVEENSGSRIRSLQILDGDLFYLFSYPQTSYYAKIKRVDLDGGLTISEIHTNRNLEYKSYISDAYVWKQENGTYNITYIHTDPTLVVSTYNQLDMEPIYILSFPHLKAYSVKNCLGKNKDLFLSFNDNDNYRKTVVLDLASGNMKYEYPEVLIPINNKYAKAYNIMVDAQNGNQIIGNDNKSEILFEHDNLVYITVFDPTRATTPTIRALDLNTKCFSAAYNHKSNNHIMLDTFSNEMIVIDTDNNKIMAFGL